MLKERLLVALGVVAWLVASLSGVAFLSTLVGLFLGAANGFAVLSALVVFIPAILIAGGIELIARSTPENGDTETGQEPDTDTLRTIRRRSAHWGKLLTASGGVCLLLICCPAIWFEIQQDEPWGGEAQEPALVEVPEGTGRYEHSGFESKWVVERVEIAPDVLLSLGVINYVTETEIASLLVIRNTVIEFDPSDTVDLDLRLHVENVVTERTVSFSCRAAVSDNAVFDRTMSDSEFRDIAAADRVQFRIDAGIADNDPVDGEFTAEHVAAIKALAEKIAHEGSS